MAHTPAPWHLVAEHEEDMEPEYSVEVPGTQLGQSIGTYVIAERIGGRIHGDDYGDFSEIEANANLIAAAPDLLEALRECALCFGTGTASDEWWEAEHDKRGPAGAGMTAAQIREQVAECARAAIARAEGRT